MQDVELISATEFRRKAGGIGRSTEFRWRRVYPDFPKPIHINGRNYYAKTEVLAWLERQREAA
jgi:predicted DNA-binding transcriptional regulator AlpA